METYDSESKGARASGFMQGNKFVVTAGSFAVSDDQVQTSLSEKPNRVTLRATLISHGNLISDGQYYKFSKDVEFNSPSEAASIIWGCNLNGRKVFGLEGTLPPTHFLHFKIDSARAIEGYKLDQVLYLSERDRDLANRRKEFDKYTCQTCGFILEITGRFVIECHHLEPIAMGIRETNFEDLISLCPTCHRIAHMREPIYTPNEITQLRRSFVH